ncbi:MAG: succinate--CoA ligase subunit beta, partial [Actinobacteria bacterium]|nr:succinate--CoA ligase subunit beta [Actinomycetota bacterium]
MDLYEYQAKQLFGKHGLPITAGDVATDVDAAVAISESINGPVVVKAQVKTGGRGKAGGVKLAKDPAETREIATAILGMDIKGHTVHKVLVAHAADIAEEYYVSFLLDRANRAFLAMASVEGGVEIEEVAVNNPEALAKIRVDALEGVTPEIAREIAAAAKFDEAIQGQVADILVQLWQVMVAEDATLVEVNPLVLTPTGEVVALDGKVTIDDNADYRQPEHASFDDS